MGIKKKVEKKKEVRDSMIDKDVQSNIKSPQSEKVFCDFNLFEYNLFWILHLMIVICVIYLVGGDIETCLDIFLQVINPLNWF